MFAVYSSEKHTHKKEEDTKIKDTRRKCPFWGGPSPYKEKKQQLKDTQNVRFGEVPALTKTHPFCHHSQPGFTF